MVSRPGFWSLRRKRKNAVKSQTDGPVQSGACWKCEENNEYSDPKTSQDSYISALEAKLAEATGIQINQLSNAALEGIRNPKTNRIENPIIGKTLKSIYAETDETYKYEIVARLPELKYEYDALEPTISKEIMKIHHSKHHQGYITNLNKAVEKLNAARRADDVSSINKLSEAIVFNGGGHINHSIFWTILSPTCGGEPTNDLASQIRLDFGSFEDFKKNMIERSSAVKGSGWGWLGWNRKTSKL
ncbi:unnamed protein product [Oikopleura dioica]|uniref:Superoxide dismutase n=1 Tax=Oikopleura dioica TaxID=34765 RepID=E4Y8Q0_OIKDI|nr:unnamed protein product [Oikopleura dioica]